MSLGKDPLVSNFLCGTLRLRCCKNDIELGGKPLVGNHRGQIFLVVGHQVCTHLRGDFVSLLFADPLNVIEVLRLTFGNSNLQLPPKIFYETGSATPGPRCASS